MNSALIHPSAKIHSTAILEGEVNIGAQTEIGAGCYLKGPLTIGENNRIAANVMIGVDPEHAIETAKGRVIIGNNNVIREFSVIQRGIGDRETEIGNNCFLMAYSYIAHDVLIESDVILSAKVALAGHCHILRGAVIGLAAALHHYTTVGQYAFVGMGCIVNKDIPPFCISVGNPARFKGFNEHALKKFDFNIQDLKIENTQLQSDNTHIKKYLQEFNLHARRKILPLKNFFIETQK